MLTLIRRGWYTISVLSSVGAITPIGNNAKNHWDNLLKGVSGADKISRFDTTKFKTDFACEIKDYDALNYFDKKQSRKLGENL
jgi:3-oxoacyl-[acyl-carrier-protein] synthase II